MIFIDDVKIADMLEGHRIMYTIIQQVFSRCASRFRERLLTRRSDCRDCFTLLANRMLKLCMHVLFTSGLFFFAVVVGMFFASTMVMVTIALVMAVIVTNIYAKKESPERAPDWCIAIVSRFYPANFLPERPINDPSGETGSPEKPEVGTRTRSGSGNTTPTDVTAASPPLQPEAPSFRWCR